MSGLSSVNLGDVRRYFILDVFGSYKPTKKCGRGVSHEKNKGNNKFNGTDNDASSEEIGLDPSSSEVSQA